MVLLHFRLLSEVFLQVGMQLAGAYPTLPWILCILEDKILIIKAIQELFLTFLMYRLWELKGHWAKIASPLFMALELCQILKSIVCGYPSDKIALVFHQININDFYIHRQKLSRLILFQRSFILLLAASACCLVELLQLSDARYLRFVLVVLFLWRDGRCLLGVIFHTISSLKWRYSHSFAKLIILDWRERIRGLLNLR